MSETAVRTIEIRVNREEAIRDLQAIQGQFDKVGRNTSGLNSYARASAQAAASTRNLSNSAAQAARAANDNASAANRAAAANANSARAANDSANAANRAAQAYSGASREIDKTGDAANRASGNLRTLAQSANSVANTILIMATGGAVAFMKLSDTFNIARSRIALTASSVDEFNASWSKAQQIAVATNSDLSTTANLYGRLNGMMVSLGGTTAQTSTAVQAWLQTLKISGTDTAGAAAATLQLSQAFGSGKLSGDEFASIAENNSYFMTILARSLGVARGELKQMAADGKLTGEAMRQALTDPAIIAETDRLFSQIPATFGGAMTNLHTAATIAMGEFGRALMAGLNLKDINFAQQINDWLPVIHEFGFAARDAIGAFANVFRTLGPIVSPILGLLRNNLDMVAWGLTSIVAASVAVKVANMAAPFVTLATSATSAAFSLGKATFEFIKLANSAGLMAAITTNVQKFTVLTKLATVAQAAFNVVAAMNPYVLIATAVAALVIGIGYLITTMKVSEDGLATWGDVGRVIFGDFIGLISSCVTAVTDFISKFDLSSIANGFMMLVNPVGTFLDMIGVDQPALFQSAWETALMATSGGFVALAAATGTTGEDIKTIASTVTEHWGAAFEGANGRSLASMGTLEAGTYQVFAGMGRAWDSFIGVIMGAGAAIGTVIYNVAIGIANAAISVYNAAVRQAESFVNSLISGVNTLIGALNTVGAGLRNVGRVNFGGAQAGSIQYASVGDNTRAAYNRGANAPNNAERSWGSAGARMGRYGDGAVSRAEREEYRRSLQPKGTTRNPNRLAPQSVGNDQLAARRPNPAGGGSAGNRGRGRGAGAGENNAAREAAAAARELERMNEKVQEFWDSFTNANDAAQLSGIQLANHNALLRIREIYGDRWAKLSDAERASIVERINNDNRRVATAKTLADMAKEAAELQVSVTNETRRQALVAAHGEQIGQRMFDQEKERDERRRAAAAAGVDIESEAFKAVERTIEGRQRELDILNERNRVLSSARDYAQGADRRRNGRQVAIENRDRRDAGLAEWAREVRATLAEGTAERARFERQFNAAVAQSAEDFRTDIYESGQQFRDNLRDVASAIGDIFGEKVGRAADGLVSIVEMLQQGEFGSGKMGASSNSPFAKLTGSLGNIFGTMGEKFQGISSALKGMSDGAAIGAAIAPIGKMFSKKFSSTGSQVGGMIGGMTPLGPVGAAIGSVLGGVVGGLFKSTKKASQSIVMENGKLVLGAVSGNSAKYKTAAKEAGQNVISGIYQLAEGLGADLNGAFSGRLASIGIRKDNYRVDPSGGSATKVKKGAIDFGKDGLDAAVNYVIRDAVKKGILTGLSSFSDRILRQANEENFDARIALAKQYETLNRELALLADPIGGGLAAITKQIDALSASMKEAGATTSELASVEKYRNLKMNEFIDGEVSSLKDFRKTLFSENAGVSAMSQLAMKEAEFSSFRSKINAGEAVDRDKFIAIAGDMMNLRGSIYGAQTNKFQDGRQEIIGLTDRLISDIEKNRIDETAAQLERQNELITQQNNILTQSHDQSVIQTDLLKKMAEAILNGGHGVVVGGGGSGGGSANGRNLNTHLV